MDQSQDPTELSRPHHSLAQLAERSSSERGRLLSSVSYAADAHLTCKLFTWLLARSDPVSAFVDRYSCDVHEQVQNMRFLRGWGADGT